MGNVAYTAEYQAYRKKREYIFCEAYLHSTETIQLSNDLMLKRNMYQDESQKILPYRILCSSTDLIDQYEKIIYSTQNMHYVGEFFDLIDHQNGRQYLIFRTDLYGYSVLDLITMKDYHYIPEESLTDDESFIWTGTHYNKSNNLLVAGGCYWAYPFDVFVVDFSEPIKLPYPELDVNRYLNGENIEEIEFIKWDENDHLSIKCHGFENKKTSERTLEKEALLEILKNHTAL